MLLALKSVFLLFLWSLAIKADLPTCQPGDFHWEYTECDSDGGRWRVQVPSANHCEGGAPKPPVRGVKCDMMCKEGEFLDIQGDQQCKECPAGTFSLGGGVRFEDFERLPQGFTTSEENTGKIFSEITNGEFNSADNNTDCKSESWHAMGKSVAAIPSTCAVSLFYTADLVHPGRVRFLYQFEDEGTILHFKVRSSSECASDQSNGYNTRQPYRFPPATTDGQWGEVEMPLSEGLNQFEWRTLAIGFHTANALKKPVKIKSIEITGIAFSAECANCTAGTYSVKGSSQCNECPKNTYSKNGAAECSSCDSKTQYSMPGADKCIDRPACTEHDYFEYHTPCENNMTQIEYKWIPNKVCLETLPESVQLPATTEPQACPPCNPGMELGDDGMCSYCPEGTFSHGIEKCQPCPANTAPARVYQLQFWNNLPLDANVSSNCIASKDECCKTESGWGTGTDNIHTLNGQCDAAFLVFSIEVGGFQGQEQYLSGEAVDIAKMTFVFETYCETDQCTLIFMQQEIDGNLEIVDTFLGAQEKRTYTLNIKSTAPRQFSWAFQKNVHGNSTYSSKAWAKVYSVDMENTLDGGAGSCDQCPQGSNREGCVPCPKNNYQDRDTSECKHCPANTIVHSQNRWGIEACLACGEGLIVHSTEEADHCMTTCKYTSKRGHEYDFTGLAEPMQVQSAAQFTASGLQFFSLFNISLCGGSFDFPEAGCYDNVTSRLSDTATEVHSPVCRSTIIPPKEDVDVIIAAQPVSVGDVLVKVTTDGSSLNITSLLHKEGFPKPDASLDVEDVHFYYKSMDITQACMNGRSTIITLRCDPINQGVGKIEIPPNCAVGTCDGCLQHFLWLSSLACPKCSDDLYTEVKGECVNGMQQIHFIGPRYCPEKPSEKGQACSILPFWLEVSIAGMCFVGLLLCVLVVYCWKRNKTLEYKYMKLVTPSDGRGGDAELPAAETCALSEDDEEEDEFDAVKFTESKSSGKSKFFNKIKSIGTKKGDNPFEKFSMSDREPLT